MTGKGSGVRKAIRKVATTFFEKKKERRKEGRIKLNREKGQINQEKNIVTTAKCSFGS